MDEVWLIRHGESESNAGLASPRVGAAGLTELGHLQAACLARAFPGPPALVVVSSFRRSRETAEPLLARFPSVPVEEWPIEEFTYLDPARYLNTSSLDRHPFVEEYWRRCDPLHRDGGVAESFAELLGRIRVLLARLESCPGPTALFGHGTFMKALVWLLLSGPADLATPEAMARFRGFRESLAVPNTSILKLGRAGSGEIRLSNFVVSHLPPDLVTPR